MKINKLFIKTLIIFFVVLKVHSSDINFEAKKMDIKNDGDLILAYDSKTNIPESDLEIISNKVEYFKNKNFIIFTGDVILVDNKKNILIKSNKIYYDKNINLAKSIGKTDVTFKNEYNIKSKNMFYDRINEVIYGNENTEIVDTEKNIYRLKNKFLFDLSKDIIKSDKSIITDVNNNNYFFENLIIDLDNNEIAGKELKVDYEDSYFGNSNNDPILKGRSAYSNKNELKIYKAVFSTCNTDKKKCRGWELNSKEFKHDKEKKIFEYKKSWFKLFDFNVFYIPYFNHPDPSVKRKSGFLAPTYSTSQNLGTSFNFPYFKVLDVDKDLTFNPRYYADKSFLLQNEYRQVLKNSNINSDFGFLVGETGTKGHFFFNQIGKINSTTDYEFNLESAKGDNYLKKYNLKENSELISDENVLRSNFDLNWEFVDSNLNTSFKVYEDLSRGYHDRYQFIFPEYSFQKNINISDDYNGSFVFDTYGYNKNYNTNLNDSVIINNFHFKSNDKISLNGIVTSYDILLKNSNSYSDNAETFQKNSSYELYEIFMFDMSLPLISKMKNYTHYLTPRATIRYSPNGNGTDRSKSNYLLNYNNAFSLNRSGSNSTVEGGEALSLGIEFKRDGFLEGNIINAKIGNVLRPKEDKKLPSKSGLDQTRSDIFGDIKYKLNNYVKLGYNFSYDRDLEYSNLDSFNIDFSVNNFVTKFDYYTKNHDFGDEETLKNTTRLNLNRENNLTFKTSKDLADNFTEYYDFVYQYITDCLSIDLNYRKTFYSDGNIEPDETLSFLLRIIPFTEFGVPNIGNVINK